MEKNEGILNTIGHLFGGGGVQSIRNINEFCAFGYRDHEYVRPGSYVGK